MCLYILIRLDRSVSQSIVPQSPPPAAQLDVFLFYISSKPHHFRLAPIPSRSKLEFSIKSILDTNFFFRVAYDRNGDHREGVGLKFWKSGWIVSRCSWTGFRMDREGFLERRCVRRKEREIRTTGKRGRRE